MSVIEKMIALFGVTSGHVMIDVSKFKMNGSGKLESTNGKRDYDHRDGKPGEPEFSQHLNGKLALAITGNRFGVIDIDPENYADFDALAWIDKNLTRIRRAQLLGSVSKSGGVRLWRFLWERLPPSTIAADLEFWAASFDTSGCSLEFWPDGKRTITLPFFNNEDRSGRTLESFVGIGDEYRITESELRYKNDSGPQLGNSRNSTNVITGFSNLVEYVPEIDTRGATRRYEFEYNGHTIGIDGIAKLGRAQHVKEQIAMQAGTWIVGLTTRRWETELTTLFENREQKSYSDNIESVMLWVMNNEIKRALSRGGSDKITRPSILFLGDFRVWLEASTRTLWYKGPLMANLIEKSGLCGKTTPQKLADVTRVCGGTVPQAGKSVPGYGTHRLHGLPYSDQLFDEIIDADDSHTTPVINFDTLNTKIEIMREEPRDTALESRLKETGLRIGRQSNY